MRHALDVTRDAFARHPLHLRHDVQLAATFGQQHVHMSVQLERWAQLALRATNTFRDRPHLAMRARQQREDAVRLAVVELAEHDRMVTICGQSVPPSRSYPARLGGHRTARDERSPTQRAFPLAK